jgi:MerR family transcriptional regulator, light-induced transcriptional regulator
MIAPGDVDVQSSKSLMRQPKLVLTPRELAEAIGASESSLRRWVDSGDLRLSRTPGGHRRIPLGEAIRLIRRIGASVVRPELLGLGGGIEPTAAAAGGASEEMALFETLLAGDREAAVQMIVSWYLDGRSLADIFDGPMRGSMHRLGELWKHEERGILIEHGGSAICAEAVATLRYLLPTVDERAPLALGGAPQDDPYLLPSMMAATTLAEAGFRDVNFGGQTPVNLLAHEAIQRDAALVWLSVSVQQDAKRMRAVISGLARSLKSHNIKLVIGGRYRAEHTPRSEEHVHSMSSMSELSGFAHGIQSR